jgi:hypothetical protein
MPREEVATPGEGNTIRIRGAASLGPGRCPLPTSCDTRLLVDLAHTHREGESGFAFIPDGTMLLTHYINLMANLRSTCARRVVLRITPPAPAAAAAAAADLPSAMDAAFTSAAATATAAATTATAAPPAVPTAACCAPAPTAPTPAPAIDLTDLSDLVSPVGAVTWRKVATPHGAGMDIVLGDAQYGQEN